MFKTIFITVCTCEEELYNFNQNCGARGAYTFIVECSNGWIQAFCKRDIGNTHYPFALLVQFLKDHLAAKL